MPRPFHDEPKERFTMETTRDAASTATRFTIAIVEVDKTSGDTLAAWVSEMGHKSTHTRTRPHEICRLGHCRNFSGIQFWTVEYSIEVTPVEINLMF